ncbi:hypothetical protein [Pelosinus sp. sgz500959]|uniref:hypothetical protein n=1 Tax=Pelosinus sp. sgz500959 TaxID=3242472 RepID=UPI00366E996B
MNTVAQCLSLVKKELDANHINYRISNSRPTRAVSSLDEELLYVIRQQIDMDGTYHLTVAAKMGKEKC